MKVLQDQIVQKLETNNRLINIKELINKNLAILVIIMIQKMKRMKIRMIKIF
jgi:hypothetical protein